MAQAGAKRLFAGLLGTLHAAKKENESGKASQIQAARAARLKELEERQARELEVLRAKNPSPKPPRGADSPGSLEARILELEADYQAEVKREASTRGFLRTATAPSLYYLPARKDGPEVQGLLARRAAEFATWQEARAARFEGARAELTRQLLEARGGEEGEVLERPSLAVAPPPPRRKTGGETGERGEDLARRERTSGPAPPPPSAPPLAPSAPDREEGELDEVALEARAREEAERRERSIQEKLQAVMAESDSED